MWHMHENQHKTTELNDREKVEAWVRKRDRVYAYLTDFYDNGGRVCQCTEDSLVLFDEKTRICYAAGPACTAPELRNSLLVMTDCGDLAHTLIDEGVYPMILECTTAVYWKQEPLHVEKPGITTRRLTEADLRFVLDNYHNPGAYEEHIRERIAYGMIGGLLDGQLAGFAGIHQEGTVGMLEVLPEFRRHGLAEVLEAEAINLQLEKHRLPYGHIRVGNEASKALQRKLGLTLDDNPMYWVG